MGISERFHHPPGIGAILRGAGSIGLVITQPGQMFPNGTFSTSSTNPSFTSSASLTWGGADSSVRPAKQWYDYQFTIQSTALSGVGMIRAPRTVRKAAANCKRITRSPVLRQEWPVPVSTPVRTEGDGPRSAAAAGSIRSGRTDRSARAMSAVAAAS